MKCQSIIECLETLSPKSFAQDWDNVGLLVGRSEKEVRKVFVALDADDDNISRAIDCGADMLITHHPLIFHSLKSVSSDDFIGRRVLRLAQHDISYYAMHTNFDVMGMADAVADELRIQKRRVLHVTYEDELGKEGIGRIGYLPEVMNLKECAEYVKKCLNIPSVTVYGDLDTVIEVAALCPGSGHDEMQEAILNDADVLITGDMTYHYGIDATAQNMCIIDAGHFGTEKIFVPYMNEYLHREFPELAVVSAPMYCPYRTI